MNAEAEIAAQIVDETVKIAINGSVAVIKVAGEGAVHGAALLAAVLSGKKKSKGKVRLQEMLREKGGITLFSLSSDDQEQFVKNAKRYGVKYCIVRDKDTPGGTVDVFVRSTDAAVVNRIVEKYGLNAVHQDVRTGNSETLMNGSPSGKNSQEEEYEYGDITISRDLNSLVIEETGEGQIKTRVPGTWGEAIRFLWLDKDNVREVHGGKSYFTHIDPEETYELYDKSGKLAETITGENLLKYYDRKDKNRDMSVEKEKPAQHQAVMTEEELRPSVRKKLGDAVKESDEINVSEQEILRPAAKTHRDHINPEKEKQQRAAKKVNAFNNFSQRKYNFDEMEKHLLAKTDSTSEKGGKLPEMTRQ